jgi:FtsP/CotA-like multicopper oxidase with cupredoxin domain
MIAGTARSLQFSTDNAGTWLIHCHVADHINAGMKAMYLVGGWVWAGGGAWGGRQG